MKELYDVIIAGAGPVGLFLACELGLAKLSVLVLERDLEPASAWKVLPLGMRGLNTVAIEALYRRGLLNKVVDGEKRPPSFQKGAGFQFGGHFAGIMLNANKFDLEKHKYRLNGPALLPAVTVCERVERALADRAADLGVKILRGNGVSKIIEEVEGSVTVEVGKDQLFRGRWLVGCDGGRSMVRKSAAIDFSGSEAKFTGYAVKCDWDHPERLKRGFHHTERGMYILAGPNVVYLTDFDGGAFDRSQEITQEHIQDVFSRISGITDVKITKLHLASSFTDRCKQAARYRKGRIVLAGDAAHIHGPVGSQGMNIGLTDAMNLGWKLAGTIRHEMEFGSQADLALLDTYESERQPIAAQVLEWTRAQVSLMQPDSVAIRKFVSEFLSTTDGTNLAIDRHWGLLQRCKDSGGDGVHPLIGFSAPDFELNDGTRLGNRLEAGRGLLIEFDVEARLRVLVAGEERVYSTQVEYICIGAKDTCGLRALLVRPDGVVAWAMDTDTEYALDAVDGALTKWFRI